MRGLKFAIVYTAAMLVPIGILIAALYCLVQGLSVARAASSPCPPGAMYVDLKIEFETSLFKKNVSDARITGCITPPQPR